MTSVWKRLQRVGKKASKFQFTASYQSLTVECVRGGKWQPNKLVVVWTRRKRRKLAKPMPWQPGISNPFRGIIVWPEPDPVDITVTLYKDSKPDSQFEDKEWTFVIEDESLNGRRKPIATGALNMVDYVSIESRTFDVTLTLKVASRKLVSASLEFNLTCVLIKEGMATDDDMISIGSMLSLGDSYYLDDYMNDDDMEVAPSPRLRHKRNLSHGQKVPAVTKLQEAEDVKTRSPAASPALSKKRSRLRSKSALGENTKTLISDLQKEEDRKRLSTGSDVSVDMSDAAQESSKDKNKMESELIKWARSCTKGYRGVKVRDMTTSWRDGLAFCAVLHHFHPDQIDFASLDPQNIKENNKLAFTAFEKLGITRLLDPMQMMFSPNPDKLSVMTYVFQIRTHFTGLQPLPPSPLSLVSSSTTQRLLPAPPQVIVTAYNEEPKDPDDTHGTDIDNSVSSKESAAKEIEEGYNPFLHDEESVNDTDSTPEQPADPTATSLGDSKERERSSEQDADSKSPSTTEENKHTLHEAAGKRNDVLVKKKTKPPPKPPRVHDITSTSSSVDASSKPRDLIDDKDKTESKGYNPFDEEEKEEVVVNKESDSFSKSSKGYNPFDDDEVDVADDDTPKKLNDTETKQGYNPFDDDNDDAEDTIQAEKVVDQNTAKKPTGVLKRRVSYPHDFNPFEDDNDDDLQTTEGDESSKRTESSEGKDNETSSASTVKSYNPFDDENDDDESISGDAGAIDTNKAESSTRKSSAESRSKVNKEAESTLPKPVEAHKKRRAPPPPAVRSSDDPWTQRLPDDATPRRRRATKPTTPGTGEQGSPQTSPAKKGPKRAAPPPPRRPPLIPSYDEWKSGASTDRAATGDHDRPAASSNAEGSPRRKISPATGDTSGKSDSSGSKSPGTARKVSGGDGANQADIKLLARQVLMDARKKAGASGALPRERVAEITKTAADKATTGSTQSEVAAQEKAKVDEQDALRKKEALRQRKEELQKRKKATEKAHMMVQNAIAREKAQKATNSPEQTRAERKGQEGDSDAPNPDAINNDQKLAGKKNLQHRPLKLKDKENDLQKRKLSTEKDVKPAPDKAGFKESEELQRIRQILNQGKKEKKTSTSENVEQETDKVAGASEGGKRKMSDSKSSKYQAVNGVKGSPNPTPPTRSKVRGPNAGLRDYVESRKMNFDAFEVPPVRRQQNDEHDNTETGKGDTTYGHAKNDDSILDGDLTQEFQDNSEYVREELKVLEEQQAALDKVGEKLETELRRAMECKGCEDEQEKLMQDWFVLVNKKNELVRRQGELNLLKNEQDLERSHDMLQRELRALLEMEDYQKTDEQREREVELMKQLVSVVNKRDQLVQFEDSQLQQAEKDALHVQKVIDSARIAKDKNECVLQ